MKKEKCDSDRRGAYVVITERGRRDIEAAAPGHVAAVRRLFVDRLTPSQLDAIGEAADDRARRLLGASRDRRGAAHRSCGAEHVHLEDVVGLPVDRSPPARLVVHASTSCTSPPRE